MAERAQMEDWVNAAVAGDLLAAQKLILLHHAKLRAFAASRIPKNLRAKLDPEDLLQEVYFEVVRRIREFEPRGQDSFFAWLARILESRLTDARRFYAAAGRDAARERRAADTPSGFDRLAARSNLDSLTPSRVFSRLEAEGLLLAALAGLSPDHRKILELRFFEDRPLAEIAREMGRSVAAAQMLCARAVRDLRKAIRDLTQLP